MTFDSTTVYLKLQNRKVLKDASLWCKVSIRNGSQWW